MGSRLPAASLEADERGEEGQDERKGTCTPGLCPHPRAGRRRVPTPSGSNLGLRYNARNEHDNAIAAFTAAIAADPRDGSSYYNRAVIRQKCGRYEAAIDDYTRAARLAPDDDIYYNRGLAYQCLGNPLAAIADYSRAIRLNPADAEAYWNRGLAFPGRARKTWHPQTIAVSGTWRRMRRKQEGDRENTPIRSSYQ